ncbi:MAG: P-type DNA transfer ATPase VirB11 [Sphingomonadaceae bacterium]|nr:P-type DNA transfer ATPase VirB11 [Sphingomonadaceae bacterium]
MTTAAEVVPLPEGVYLSAHLAPFQPWLAREDVSEVMVNRPGELWVDGAGGMARVDAPAVDDRLLERLAQQIARASHQGINRERPLLAATLPDGARVQVAAPPATREHWALAIRRHRVADVPLDAYDRGPIAPPPPPAWRRQSPHADPVGFLKAAAAARATILISGGTSSGKTTFLNALMREVPRRERIILVEDTPEIRLSHRNALGLVAVRGELGEARVTTDDLLQASLRMRPDRIVLGELRGREAVSFLRAINTGHPGSFSTIHANSPTKALDQLALMVMQTGLGLSRAETIVYARSVIDVVVQLELADGERRIAEILIADGA